MKITDEHYEILASACREVLARCPNAQAEYAAQGLSDKRFRWDVLHAAVIDGERGYRFVCEVLYPYMNDTHIDTALRRIIPA